MNARPLQDRRPPFSTWVDDVRWGWARAIELANDRARSTGLRQIVTALYSPEQVGKPGGHVLRDCWQIQEVR